MWNSLWTPATIFDLRLTIKAFIAHSQKVLWLYSLFFFFFISNFKQFCIGNFEISSTHYFQANVTLLNFHEQSFVMTPLTLKIFTRFNYTYLSMTLNAAFLDLMFSSREQSWNFLRFALILISIFDIIYESIFHIY